MTKESSMTGQGPGISRDNPASDLNVRKWHELKCWPKYFEKVVSGEKPFEYRRLDRDFEVGDGLYLREFEPAHARYTGRAYRVIVTYLLPLPEFKNEPPGCVMGIRSASHFHLDAEAVPQAQTAVTPDAEYIAHTREHAKDYDEDQLLATVEILLDRLEDRLQPTVDAEAVWKAALEEADNLILSIGVSRPSEAAQALCIYIASQVRALSAPPAAQDGEALAHDPTAGRLLSTMVLTPPPQTERGK